jgi:hypothetical protein
MNRIKVKYLTSFCTKFCLRNCLCSPIRCHYVRLCVFQEEGAVQCSQLRHDAPRDNADMKQANLHELVRRCSVS